MKHVKSNIDMSYSMFIDGNKPIMQQSKGRNCKKKIKKLRRVEPKTLYHWVEDEQVTSCYDCKTEFPARSFWNGWSSGKHHCRNCGRAVCGNCSSHTMILNKYLGDSKPHGRVARTSSNPLRVCDYCSDQNNAKECKVFQQWCSDKGNICPGQMAAGGLTRIKNKHRRKPKKTIRRKKSHKRKPKKTIRRKKSIKRNKSYNKKPKKTIKRKKSRGRSRRRMR